MPKTQDPESLREKNRTAIKIASDKVDDRNSGLDDALEARDHLLADLQGAPSEGKFSYTELSAITGLSRTRIGQIIRDVRKGRR